MARGVKHELTPEAEQAIARLGQRLDLLRRMQRLNLRQLAAEAGISVNTLRAILRGDPGTAIGNYVAVLWRLDQVSSLDALAPVSGDEERDTKIDRFVPSRVKGGLSDDF